MNIDIKKYIEQFYPIAYTPKNEKTYGSINDYFQTADGYLTLPDTEIVIIKSVEIKDTDKILLNPNNNQNFEGFNNINFCSLRYIYFSDLTIKLTGNCNNLFTDSCINQDISGWDTSEMTSSDYMFFDTPFNFCISRWDTRSLNSMKKMFERSKFNQDIS